MFGVITMGQFLVTGAAGFIGSHICERLLSDGHKVVGIDNFVTGSEENIDSNAYSQRFTLLETDVTTPFEVAGDFDWVIHLAALASPEFYRDHPIKTLKTGSVGMHTTLETALEKGASYLYASTSEVYGDPEINPQREEYRGNVDPFGPRSCYNEAKRYGESITRAFQDEHDLDVRIARIFNTYGPRMRVDDGRVVPTFIRQALTNAPLTVYGDGSQTRSFCYIADLVSGLISLIDSDVRRPVNIGNPDERTILEFAEMILELTSSESVIQHQPLPPQDPQVRCPDITKAKASLGWKPHVDLREGLQRTIRYYRYHENIG